MRAILTYHSIDDSGSPISVSPEQFRRHVAWLAGGTVRVVGLVELVALPDEVDAVAVTFDDGFRSVAQTGAPVLAAHGLPATVFVVSQHVGGDNQWVDCRATGIPVLPLLDWEALGRLQASGFEVGAHSRSHPRLTSCDAQRLADELHGSAEDITRALGSRPTAFAYPYGDLNDAVASAVATTYACACTTELRPLHGAELAERLPRLDAYYLRAGKQLDRWGTAAFRRYLAGRRVLRGVREALA